MNIALDQKFWNDRYEAGTTGWDLGKVSEPIAAYIDQLEDKALRILIPGCGNAYEAAYLAEKGFQDITLIDIAPKLVCDIQERFAHWPQIKVVEGDFFLHEAEYGLILEQTFFCAIDPALRPEYVRKMNELLAPGGKIAGVLFDTTFSNPGPPFGGQAADYAELFQSYFDLKTLTPCYNSARPRAGNEAFIIAMKPLQQ
jgi:SAM-dependent methyltransferase